MKNKILSKILSMLLTVVIIFFSAPLSEFIGLDMLVLFSTKAEAYTHSGSCGKSLSWSLDTETGVLNITGIGAMENYTSSLSVPWNACRSFVKTVNIADGITSIGHYTFSNCENLTSVVIPNSATSIGGYAFANCESITSVAIPASVTSINHYTFNGCKSLTSINVDEDNTYYSNDEYGVLFNKDKTTLVCCPGGKAGGYTIPDSVTSIGSCAFESCTSITSVKIGDGVTSIGNNAFHNCRSLTLVEMGEGVTSIGRGVFNECRSLTSITIGNSVRHVGSSAFYNCTSLTDVYYSGSKSQWSAILFDNGNHRLKNANIHFNYEKPEVGDEPIVTVDIWDDFSNITVGDETTYFVDVTDAEGKASEKLFSATTTDSSVASVVSLSIFHSDENSVTYFVRVKANGIGTCTLNASADGVSDLCKITVKGPELSTRLTAGLTMSPQKINYYGKNNVDHENISVICRVTNTISNSKGNISEFLKDEEYDAYVSSVKIDLSNTDFVSIDGESSVTIPVNKTLKAKESTKVSCTLKVKDKLKLDDETQSVSVTLKATVSASINGESKTLIPSKRLTLVNKKYIIKQEEQTAEKAKNAYDAYNKLKNKPGNSFTTGPNGNAIFTDEEKKLVEDLLYMQLLTQLIPEESLTEKIKDKLQDIVIDDVTGEVDSELTDSLKEFLENYDYDGEVYTKDAEASVIISTKDHGDVKVTAKTSMLKNDLKDKHVSGFGPVEITYEGEDLPKGMIKTDTGIITTADVDGFVEAAQEVVVEEIEEMYDDIYGNDLDTVTDMLLGQTGKKIIQAAGYNSASNMVYEAITWPSKKFCYKCPVDVFVYDSQGNLCASAENDVVTLTDKKAKMSVEGDEKTVILYGDNYTVVAKPTGDGVMNVTVEEYANSRGLIKTININDIPLEFGENYIQSVDMELLGDEDKYMLTNESDNSQELPDEVIKNLHYHTDENDDGHCDICLNLFEEEEFIPENDITVVLADKDGEIIKEVVVLGDTTEITFDGLDNGEYTLIVSAENYVTRTYSVTAEDSKVVAEFKLNIIGDLNGDGRVNTIDVSRANAHAKGTSTLTGYEFSCVDINGDGKVNTLDVTRMNAHAKGVSLLW